jgi:hypothetical protein
LNEVKVAPLPLPVPDKPQPLTQPRVDTPYVGEPAELFTGRGGVKGNVTVDIVAPEGQ